MSISDTRSSPTSSPCIGRCTTTTGDLVCRGCGRTVGEIRDWNTYSDEVKISVKISAKWRLGDRDA